MRVSHQCENAHGISELNRSLTSDEVLELRKELYEVKQALNKIIYRVLYNPKSKRVEHYKISELSKLKGKGGKANQVVGEAENLNDVEEADDGQEGEEEERVKKSIQNLNLEECIFYDNLRTKYELHRFDINKILGAYDEVNDMKRKPRNKGELAIIRPWQNEIMTKFLELVLRESQNGYLHKSSVMKKFNEAAMPITWTRLDKVYFEKKSTYPPWSLSKKITFIVPLRDEESNLKRTEELISNIIKAKIDQQKEKFKLPIRLNDI